MPLDLGTTAEQIDRMAVHIAGRRTGREEVISRLVAALRSLDPARYEPWREEIARSENRATVRFLESPSETFPPPQLPTELTVGAVDGSQIGVDRHLAARCFLINIGRCVLTYGSEPSADLGSQPTLHSGDEQISIRDEVTGRTERVEGPVLAALRHVRELEEAARLTERDDRDHPTVLLMDGPLTVAGLSGRIFPEFVLRTLVTEGFAGAMDRLRRAGGNRDLVVAGYTSFPSHDEVARALISAPGWGREAGLARRAPHGVMDLEIFERHLPAGHRSAMLESTGHPLAPYQGGHGAVSFYMNAGTEIARVELPTWAVEDTRSVDLVHAVLIDQCRRGDGYPTVLVEAHEQAVVTARDRRAFVDLLESALADQGVPARRSEKGLSKPVRRL